MRRVRATWWRSCRRLRRRQLAVGCSAARCAPRLVRQHWRVQGRHAAAVRVLARGLRVLEGRERNREGTACALQLGWLALERGDAATALGRFETARALAEDPEGTVLASVGAGTALIEADRLVEAEAVLRGAVAAAETLQDPDSRTAAVAALARCLYWQRRWHDALALIAQCSAGVGSPLSRVRMLAIHARCLAQVGRTSEALRTARESQAAAGSTDDPGAVASAELAVAEALIAAGRCRWCAARRWRERFTSRGARTSRSHASGPSSCWRR